MREKFWELPLSELTPEEWEALCDGCGKCCLIKLEDEDTGEIVYTKLACKMLCPNTAQCLNYQERLSLVDDCLVLTPQNIESNANWLPKTCAYYRRYLNEDLPDWHYLKTQTHRTMHEGGHSVAHRIISEEVMTDLEDAIDYIDRSLGP